MLASAFRRFAFTYGASFGIFYALARAKGLALFTTYPTIGVVVLGMHHSRDVVDPAIEFPEMWWYGWVNSAVIGAFAVGLVAALLPERWCRWFWPGWVWVAPVLAMIACVYLTLPWFRMYVVVPG